MKHQDSTDRNGDSSNWRIRPLAAGLVALLGVAGLPAVQAIELIQIGTWQGVDSTYNTGNDPVYGRVLPELVTGGKYVIKTTYDPVVNTPTTRTVTNIFNPAMTADVWVINLQAAGNAFELLVPMEGQDGAPGTPPFVYTQTQADHLTFFHPVPEIHFAKTLAGQVGDANAFVGYEFEGDYNPGVFPPTNPTFIELFPNVVPIDPGTGTPVDTYVNNQYASVCVDVPCNTGQAATSIDGIQNAVPVLAEAGPDRVYSAGSLTVTTDGGTTQDNGLGFGRADKEDFLTYDWSQGGTSLGAPSVDGTRLADGQPAENVNVAVAIADSGLTNTTDTRTWQLVVSEDLTGLGGASAVGATDTLQVSYNNTGPSANAGPNLMFDASNFTRNTAGVVDDADLVVNSAIAGFETLDAEWSRGGTSIGSGAVTTLSIADAGLTMTTAAPTTLVLTATDLAGAQAADALTASYDNAAPEITTAAAATQVGGVQFELVYTDVDLAGNAFLGVTDFEMLGVAVDVAGFGDQTTFFQDLIDNMSLFLTDSVLFGQFGTGSLTANVTVTDKAGLFAAASFGFEVVEPSRVPAPGSLVLVALGLAAMGARRRRKMF